jgi:hypothetical protein
MIDELISYETAELAKHKKFNITCDFFFYKDRASDGWDSQRIERPTQSLLQRWLRERHGIGVLVSIDGELMYNWAIGPLHPGATSEELGKNYYVTSQYEDALEEALLQALKLI